MENSMFHPDGCVRANIRVKKFRAVLAPACPHTKITLAVIEFTAENLTAAEAYIRAAWVRIPQVTVRQVFEIGPAGEMSPDRWPLTDGSARLITGRG